MLWTQQLKQSQLLGALRQIELRNIPKMYLHEKKMAARQHGNYPSESHKLITLYVLWLLLLKIAFFYCEIKKSQVISWKDPPHYQPTSISKLYTSGRGMFPSSARKPWEINDCSWRSLKVLRDLWLYEFINFFLNWKYLRHWRIKWN